MTGYRADYPSEWERRLISVRDAAQEILDVAGGGKAKPAGLRQPDRAREARDKWIYDQERRNELAYKSIIAGLAKEVMGANHLKAGNTLCRQAVRQSTACRYHRSGRALGVSAR